MMYTLKGNLIGVNCDDRFMQLANTKVRLYRFMGKPNEATLLATAQAKENFQLIEEKDIQKKEKYLLVEGKTDKNGNYSLTIDDKKTDYKGEVVEFVIYYDSVPDYGQKDKKPSHHFKSFAASLNIIQPGWKEGNRGLEARWNYRIAHKLWCLILSRLDIWVICGTLLNCESQQPIAGIEVIAMDDDWITDDKLGSAVTDGNGMFCIVYRSKDFKKTFLSPLINVETPLFPWGNGPDIYFKYAMGGVVFNEEPPSRARQSDRENVGNCFCVSLCLKEGSNGEDDKPVASFFDIGFIRRYHSILNINPVDGRTTGKVPASWNNQAFYGTIALLGSLTKKLNGQPLEYKFQYAELSNPTDPIPTAEASWVDVNQNFIAHTVIGYKRILLSPGPFPFPVFITKDYALHAESYEEDVLFNGNWVIVPQDAGFIPNVNGSLIRLITSKLANGSVDMTGLVQGKSTTDPPPAIPLQKNRYFSIRMKKRQAGNAATEEVAGLSRPLAIFNTVYRNVPQRGSWFPSISNELGVAALDIKELKESGGCSKITNKLHANYTAANPNLGYVNLSMEGPGGPHSFDPVVFTTPGEEAHGTASYIGDVSSLPNCSYAVKVTAQLNLTNGEDQHRDIWDRVQFCK